MTDHVAKGDSSSKVEADNSEICRQSAPEQKCENVICRSKNCVKDQPIIPMRKSFDSSCSISHWNTPIMLIATVMFFNLVLVVLHTKFEWK